MAIARQPSGDRAIIRPRLLLLRGHRYTSCAALTAVEWFRPLCDKWSVAAGMVFANRLRMEQRLAGKKPGLAEPHGLTWAFEPGRRFTASALLRESRVPRCYGGSHRDNGKEHTAERLRRQGLGCTTFANVRSLKAVRCLVHPSRSFGGKAPSGATDIDSPRQTGKR
jgi:hypothetical protein